MNTMTRTAAGAVLGGALLAGGFGLAGLAQAAPEAEPVVSDGKVNVTVTADGQEVGVLQNLTLAKADALVASACGNAGVTTDALKALDLTGAPVPPCATPDGLSFAFAQNTPGTSANVPTQENGIAPSSPAGTPSSDLAPAGSR